MRRLTIGLFAILTLATTARPAQALPITYAGALTDSVPSLGTSTQDDAGLFFSYTDDPEGADYWSLSVLAGARVTVSGRRLAEHFDMVLWVFRNPDQSGDGRYEDTSEFGGFLTPATPGFVGFFDDNIDVPGPFGDPQGQFIAPATGVYTFIVTSGLSDVGSPDPYSLQVSTMPEPGTLVLLGTGLTLVARASRRRLGHPSERR